MNETKTNPQTLELEQRVQALEQELKIKNKVCQVLMDRVERSVAESGSSFSLFETNILLQEKVKQRTGELQDQNAYMETILASMSDALFVVSNEGIITKVNDSAANFLEDQIDHIVGRPFTEMVVMAHDPLSEHSHEGHLITKKGNKKEILLSKARMTDQEGLTRGAVYIAMEITQRKSLQRAELSKKLAEKSNRAKSEFIANMSHEFRTPLNAIIGFSELALDSCTDPDQKEFIKIIDSSSKMLIALINDVLDIAKIEAGKLVFAENDFNLRKCLEKSTQDFAPKFEAKGIDFSLDIGLHVPDMIKSDCQCLSQVVRNLLSNALKFTKAGEVSLSVRFAQKPGQADSIKFFLSDTGIGIPQDKLDAIFESFVQADASMVRQYGGTGLGLSISKKLVELMGGTIYVTSEEGQGSTFIFNILSGIPGQDFQSKPLAQAGLGQETLGLNGAT